jgi:hypothetical protein
MSSDIQLVTDEPESPLSELERHKRYFEATISTPQESVAEAPALPDAADRLAQIQALWAAAETWREGFHRQLEEVQPILDEHAKAEERAALDAQISAIKTSHGLEHIPEKAIEAAIRGGDVQTLAALRKVNDEIDSRSLRSDTERAILATRNISFDGPPALRFDAEYAFACSDRDWEVYKRKILDSQRGR